MEKQVATPELLYLLRAAAAGRHDVDLDHLAERSVQRALDGGLGPLLFHVTKNHPSRGLKLRPLLHSANITSRLLVEEQLDGLLEILRALGGLSRHVVLLKGISVCQTHYPSPHLRVMGDIDLLVIDDEIRNTVERRLCDLGYRQQSHYPPEFYRTLHHSMPFFHPRRKIWIEVHRRLFPPSAAVACDRVFSLDHIATQTVPWDFRGTSCSRLMDEMQLVYTCSHWGREINPVRGLVPMLDVIYLLERGVQEMNWDKILSWLPGSTAATDLYLMISYLRRHGIGTVPGAVIDGAESHATNISRINISLLWQLIDTFLMEGRYGRVFSEANVGIVWKTLLSPGSPTLNLLSIPWHLALPPDDPRRFSPLFHLRRLASAIGLRR